MGSMGSVVVGSRDERRMEKYLGQRGQVEDEEIIWLEYSCGRGGRERERERDMLAEGELIGWRLARRRIPGGGGGSGCRVGRQG